MTTLWVGDFDVKIWSSFRGSKAFNWSRVVVSAYSGWRLQEAWIWILVLFWFLFFLSVYFLFFLYSGCEIWCPLGESWELRSWWWCFENLHSCFCGQNWMCCQCFDSSLVSSNSQRNCLDLMCHKDRHRKMGSSEPSFWVNPIVERVLLLLPGSLPRFSQHFWVCLLTLPYSVSQ